MWAIIFKYNETEETFIGENRYYTYASAMSAILEIKKLILTKLDQDDEIGNKPYYPVAIERIIA